MKVGDTEPDYYSYSYNWIKNTAENTLNDNIYVEKSSIYNGNLAINSPSGSVITNVIIEIIWEDDYTHGILRSRGEDTLTLTITAQNNQINSKHGTLILKSYYFM